MATGTDTGVVPILGTMTFGAEGQVKPDQVTTMLRCYCGSRCAKTTPQGRVLIDTARVYQQGTPDGDTEATLGEAFESSPSLMSKCSVATKANLIMAPHFSLSRQSVIDQCNTSLEKLDADCVDLFYLHSPDIKTDIEDTLAGIECLHTEGKIKEFGLSNYPAWAVVDIWYRCKRRGMVLPTVYQGMYNVITRDMEREIVPVAREFGIKLYMYNPLGGGMLTGRYETMDDLACAQEGRFSEEFDNAFGSAVKAGTHIYRSRYSKQPLFDGVEILRKACAPLYDDDLGASPGEGKATVEESVRVIDGVTVRVEIQETAARAPSRPGVAMAQVALRWLIHHSYLARGDGIIIGASKNNQLVANLAAWQAGPLPAHLLEACDMAWEASRSACESYFRGYGATPGGIEQFLTRKLELASKAQEEEVELGTAKSQRT